MKHLANRAGRYFIAMNRLRKALATQEGDRPEVAFSRADCEVQCAEEARALMACW